MACGSDKPTSMAWQSQATRRGVGSSGTHAVSNAAAGAEQIIGQPHHRSRFDYVFVGSWDAHPKGHARVVNANLAFDQQIDGIWASDHFGLVVELEVGKND